MLKQPPEYPAAIRAAGATTVGAVLMIRLAIAANPPRTAWIAQTFPPAPERDFLNQDNSVAPAQIRGGLRTPDSFLPRYLKMILMLSLSVNGDRLECSGCLNPRPIDPTVSRIHSIERIY